MWTGEQALAKGLIDGLGSAGYVGREVIGIDDFVDYTIEPNPLNLLLKELVLVLQTVLFRYVINLR